MFKTLLYIPFYNALIFFTALIPGANVGLAIILLTILVKLIIFPLYTSSIKTQMKMKEIEPKVKEIKEKYKDDLPTQSRLLMALYQENKVKPFVGILVLVIQLPIIITLFYVFKDSLIIQPDLLYSFIHAPKTINTEFLGVNLAARSYLLAFLTGLTQFFQVQLSLPKPALKVSDGQEVSFKNDFARSMDIQMRYVMPIVIAFISLSLPAAVALYWVTSNLFSVIYEVFVKRHLVRA
ncbi:MAG: YidC/Oxa1 family membrane protein insertase [Cyanobacteria bacterium]|nr:YidC/Oxa1 family membrane protein insertase [Cyanobacteriota bacterium]